VNQPMKMTAASEACSGVAALEALVKSCISACIWACIRSSRAAACMHTHVRVQAFSRSCHVASTLHGCHLAPTPSSSHESTIPDFSCSGTVVPPSHHESPGSSGRRATTRVTCPFAVAPRVPRSSVSVLPLGLSCHRPACESRSVQPFHSR
jgi:hypothetical protein